MDFSGSKTINEIDVYTLHDNAGSVNTPTETQTFSLYGLTSYDVQYWDGSAWQTLPNGSITGNNKVWKKLTFSSITTSKIRVSTNASADGYSRIVELEAWTPGSSGSSSGGINWLVTDQLGTPRMIFDQSGALTTTKRHDYAPFWGRVVQRRTRCPPATAGGTDFICPPATAGGTDFISPLYRRWY